MQIEQVSATVMDAIMQRRSIRRYRRELVQREIIQAILEAATWSPSAHNRQPWRFAVIESQSQKEILGAGVNCPLPLDGRYGQLSG
jgi:nitroreductase